jgi:hypothetical protein
MVNIAHGYSKDPSNPTTALSNGPDLRTSLHMKKSHLMKINWIEDPDINPCNYSHLTSKKGAQNMTWRKDSLFNKWCWENGISTCRLDPSLSHCTSVNSTWTEDLNIRSEMMKLVQEKQETHRPLCTTCQYHKPSPKTVTNKNVSRL